MSPDCGDPSLRGRDPDSSSDDVRQTSAPPARPAAELGLTGGFVRAVCSPPGCARVRRLVLAFRLGKGWGTLVEGSSQKSLDRVSSSFFCNLSACVNSAFRGRGGSPAPPAFLQFQPLRRVRQGGVFLEVGRQLWKRWPFFWPCLGSGKRRLCKAGSPGEVELAPFLPHPHDACSHLETCPPLPPTFSPKRSCFELGAYCPD